MRKVTGRINSLPASDLIDEVLFPQFNFEINEFLPYYIRIEEVMLEETLKLNLINKNSYLKIKAVLQKITSTLLHEKSTSSMNDILFSIENYVYSQIPSNNIVKWHVDRSRNDIQATAQIMYAKDQLIRVIENFLVLIEKMFVLARNNFSLPMPGYTQYQSAQIITPGYYFSGILESLLRSCQKLFYIFDEINKCPMGAGALSGLEISWDRKEIAKKLGFTKPYCIGISGIASKEWLLNITSEFSIISVVISRLMTDLLYWGSSQYNFINLPDNISGISSAMPHKKNYPILERVRGKTGHILSYFNNFAMLQRNNPFTNLVETGKEGTKSINQMFNEMNSIFKLSNLIIGNLSFNGKIMKSICGKDFLGGFSLANYLTLKKEIPTRLSHIITGKYILLMTKQKRTPFDLCAKTLESICKDNGYLVSIEKKVLTELFSVDYNLNKKTDGSTNPDEVLSNLDNQMLILADLKEQLYSKKEYSYQELGE
ncbi:lyase family protein [Oceanobacillus kimchii]|uniref:lyase family protein n=1 Tax=Oceanobacillus kimchii TaxID=746691 RepID=UPI003B01CD86